jgi:crotonobetainyl-CoA:carnitine CoA-transferase CaiB-like acyl-CoA transferase
MEGLFKGVKVVDAASFLAGPCAATIMADYGADVIKIEPLSGDGHRGISGGHPSEWSWQLTNRNKRSVSLDINKPEGYQLLIRLIESADVLVVNFSSSQLAKFNLEWDTLKAINPRLVFAQITAFGNKGADANRRAFDLTGWFAKYDA